LLRVIERSKFISEKTERNKKEREKGEEGVRE
jgi:hypothetical protein